MLELDGVKAWVSFSSDPNSTYLRTKDIRCSEANRAIMGIVTSESIRRYHLHLEGPVSGRCEIYTITPYRQTQTRVIRQKLERKNKHCFSTSDVGRRLVLGSPPVSSTSMGAVLIKLYQGSGSGSNKKKQVKPLRFQFNFQLGVRKGRQKCDVTLESENGCDTEPKPEIENGESTENPRGGYSSAVGESNVSGSPATRMRKRKRDDVESQQEMQLRKRDYWKIERWARAALACNAGGTLPGRKDLKTPDGDLDHWQLQSEPESKEESTSAVAAISESEVFHQLQAAYCKLDP